MEIERKTVEKAFATILAHVDAGNWDGFVDCFAEDCTWVNSVLSEPLQGREALRAFAATWPVVVNRPEWVVIDGPRLAFGWNERQDWMPPDGPVYRGFSTYVFNADGLVRSYEGIFDTAALGAALDSARAMLKEGS